MKAALKIYFSQINILFYTSLALLGLIYGVQSGALWKYSYLALIILVLSPFNEYFTHQYFLHLSPPRDRGKHRWYATFLEHIHYRHHEEPRDVNYIFAQLWLTGPVCLCYIVGVYWLTGSFDITVVFLTTVILYYLIYEWTHFVAHSDYMPRNAYGRYMKKYHLLHHYKNENYWYGITSPLADMLFARNVKPEAVSSSHLALENRELRAQGKR